MLEAKDFGVRHSLNQSARFIYRTVDYLPLIIKVGGSYEQCELPDHKTD
jgi:hypothetical protein